MTSDDLFVLQACVGAGASLFIAAYWAATEEHPHDDFAEVASKGCVAAPVGGVAAAVVGVLGGLFAVSDEVGWLDLIIGAGFGGWLVGSVCGLPTGLLGAWLGVKLFRRRT